MDEKDLRIILNDIDSKGYKAYKRLKGSYQFSLFTLCIDHVQGDPFSTPSKIRIKIETSINSIPKNLSDNHYRKLALQDFLSRRVNIQITKKSNSRNGTGNSGVVFIDSGGQEVIERTALVIKENFIEARMQIGLPARSRRILSKEAIQIFFNDIPNIIEASLIWKNLNQEKCIEFVECIENYYSISAQLKEKNLVAFIANGSNLARESGVSQNPLKSENSILFKSPKTFETSFILPNPIKGDNHLILGMGIPEGITLIVGGGYHGKSTFLKSLERGVYPHIPNDGREYVVTRKEAVKIRSEEGRNIENVDIKPFINNLPNNIKTSSFCSENASGSTSQAANIIEALELGAQFLLIDEDTSATNFMFRDIRMQTLVPGRQEPITPYLDRITEFYEDFNISTILIMGGTGDYFEVADNIIKMESYVPYDVKHETSLIIKEHPSRRVTDNVIKIKKITQRVPKPFSINSLKSHKRMNIKAPRKAVLLFGDDEIDLKYLDQLIEKSQTKAIGFALHLASKYISEKSNTLQEVIAKIETFINKNGLDQLDPYFTENNHPGNFSRPRKYEIGAAINRLRSFSAKIID